jgi:hypothetical protein
MTQLDWFIMESFCYPLFIDIIIMDIQRVNNRIAYLEKPQNVGDNALELKRIMG